MKFRWMKVGPNFWPFSNESDENGGSVEFSKAFETETMSLLDSLKRYKQGYQTHFVRYTLNFKEVLKVLKASKRLKSFAETVLVFKISAQNF